MQPRFVAEGRRFEAGSVRVRPQREPDDRHANRRGPDGSEYTAEINLTSIRSRNAFSEEAGELLGLDPLELKREIIEAANARMKDLQRSSVFKLQLVMFFEDLHSERQLMGVVADRLSLRWYVGYDLHEPLPDHSSLTRIRERYSLVVFRRFFERIVEMCAEAGLV